MAQKAFVPLVEHSTSQKTLFPLVEFSRFGWHNEWQQSGNEKNQKTVTLYFISLKYCMLTRSSKYTISTFIIFYNHPYHHAIWQQCYSMQVRSERRETQACLPSVSTSENARIYQLCRIAKKGTSLHAELITNIAAVCCQRPLQVSGFCLHLCS